MNATTTTGTTANVFDLAVANFLSVSEIHAEHGAADTEPRAIFAELVDDALTYGPGHAGVPATAAGWELYDITDDADGAAQAARDLAIAAAIVVNVVNTDDTTRAAANKFLGR